MIHVRAVLVLLVTVACASCGSSNPITGPAVPLPPQRTVWGSVQDTAFRRIAGAQIAVVGTSLSTVTGAGVRVERR